MSKDIREMIDKVKNFSQFINENFTIAYKCIDSVYNNNFNKIEFFSKNKNYSKSFGDKCYKVKIDTVNAKILDLEKWNIKYTNKTGKKGNMFNRHQGLFVIGEMAINSNYSEELNLFSQSCGEKLAEQFVSELNICDAIYGEDAGYVGEFVFAVKNKNIIINIEAAS